MPEALTTRIDAALAWVVNTRTGQNLIQAEMVRDIATTTDGNVRFTMLLTPQDDATLVRAARQAVEKVSGVASVRVDVKDPAEPPPPKKPASRALPVMS